MRTAHAILSTDPIIWIKLMLIDLHCHTRKARAGDGEGREVSDDLFVEKIKASGVEIVAVTNHNIFDSEQFLRLQDKIKGDCMLWPGVELDIGYGGAHDKYHLLVICNPKNIDGFESAIVELTSGYTPENFVVGVETVVSKFEQFDCIFSPHYIGKARSIPDEEYEKLFSLLSNKNRLIAEASNVRSMGIFISHGINAITGSDIKDWNNYPGICVELPELRLDVGGYEHFCRLLDRDPAVVKTLLDKNRSSPYDVYPCHDNFDIKETLHFYKEVNVIFGDKGTGKSEVISSLANKMKSEGIPYVEYISGSTKDYLDELLRTDDMERSARILGLNSCEDDFETIINWGDKSPTPIVEYVEYFKTRTNKDSVKRVGWSRTSDMVNHSDNLLAKILEDLDNINFGIEYLSKIEMKSYLDSEDGMILNNILSALKNAIEKKMKTTKVEKKAIDLTNFTLRAFREYTSAKTGSATRPQDAGFGKFAKNRLALKMAINNINSNLISKENNRYDFLGDIGEKGKIEIEICHRMLDDSPVTKSSYKEFSGNIEKLKKLKKKIRKIRTLILTMSLDNEIVDLKDKLVKYGVNSTDDFVGIYKQTVDKDHNPYIPSKGECSIIFIQRALGNQAATVFLLDEPEQSMANSYIDDIIRPRITQLGRQKKTIILATHNANLAVRTLPYLTVYRSHGASGYNTYIGNPFSNQLENINNPIDKLDWKEVSMRILEGGKEAFYDREGIYESGR